LIILRIAYDFPKEAGFTNNSEKWILICHAKQTIQQTSQFQKTVPFFDRTVEIYGTTIIIF